MQLGSDLDKIMKVMQPVPKQKKKANIKQLQSII